MFLAPAHLLPGASHAQDQRHGTTLSDGYVVSVDLGGAADHIRHCADMDECKLICVRRQIDHLDNVCV